MYLTFSDEVVGLCFEQGVRAKKLDVFSFDFLVKLLNKLPGRIFHDHRLERKSIALQFDQGAPAQRSASIEESAFLNGMGNIRLYFSMRYSLTFNCQPVHDLVL